MLPPPHLQAAILRGTSLTLTAGPDKTVGVATGMFNVVASLCGAALRRLPRHAWLQAVAAFVRGLAVRGPPLAVGACGHPQRAIGDGPAQHEMHACPRCTVLVSALCTVRSMLPGALYSTYVVRSPPQPVTAPCAA